MRFRCKATPPAIVAGGVRRNDEGAQTDALREALVTRDRKTVYRVDDGIPVLLAEEGIATAQVDGANAVGPHLDGVVGRPVASVEGFSYSDGMTAHGGDWTPEQLFAFLANPKKDVPGTKMAFAGLPKPEDRANVIAYLESVQ